MFALSNINIKLREQHSLFHTLVREFKLFFLFQNLASSYHKELDIF